MSYIYLASPYSIDAPAETLEGRSMRLIRYHAAVKAVAEFSKQGEVVFSPIVHSHPLSVLHDLPGTWDFWSKIDYAFIDSCSKVRVMKWEGWDRSVGIKAETDYAKSIGKEIEYVG